MATKQEPWTLAVCGFGHGPDLVKGPYCICGSGVEVVEVVEAAPLWTEAHARIQTLRGECSDELPYEMLDQALAALDDRLYAMTHPAGSERADV